MNGMSKRAFKYFPHYNVWWLLLQWIKLHFKCVGGTVWRDSSGLPYRVLFHPASRVLWAPQIVSVLGSCFEKHLSISVLRNVPSHHPVFIGRLTSPSFSDWPGKSQVPPCSTHNNTAYVLQEFKHWHCLNVFCLTAPLKPVFLRRGEQDSYRAERTRCQTCGI